jgi:hypothetical protein
MSDSDRTRRMPLRAPRAVHPGTLRRQPSRARPARLDSDRLPRPLSPGGASAWLVRPWLGKDLRTDAPAVTFTIFAWRARRESGG